MKARLPNSTRHATAGRREKSKAWGRRGSLWLLLTACPALACKSTGAEPAVPVTPAAPGAASGEWQSLLPAATLEGFRRVPIDPLASKNVWQVRPDGVLYVDGVGAKEMLLSERELGDGHLQVEWRFLPMPTGTDGTAPTYNGGVYVRTPLDGKSWVQLQVAISEKQPVVGDLIAQVPGKTERVDVFQSARQAQPPVGEWVLFDVVMRGPRIELRVNGLQTVAWAECPMLTGHVGLQAEGAPIEVRTLRYQPL